MYDLWTKLFPVFRLANKHDNKLNHYPKKTITINNVQFSGYQNVRMGNTFHKIDSVRSQNGTEHCTEKFVRSRFVYDVPIVHYEDGTVLYNAVDRFAVRQ